MFFVFIVVLLCSQKTKIFNFFKEYIFTNNLRWKHCRFLYCYQTTPTHAPDIYVQHTQQSFRLM